MPNREGVIDHHVLAVVKSASEEIRGLLRQRAELMKRIGTIKQTLAGLADIFGEGLLDEELLQLLDRKPLRHAGFTSACRAVLMNSPVPLSARQVRDQIRKKFPGLIERHKDPLASVTTVLTRLVQYDEARCRVQVPGRRTWEWASEQPGNHPPSNGQTAEAEELQVTPLPADAQLSQ